MQHAVNCTSSRTSYTGGLYGFVVLYDLAVLAAQLLLCQLQASICRSDKQLACAQPKI
jgi:hypothetical protein